MDVPEFKTYYATTSSMNPEQRRFYEYWQSQWEKCKAIPVNGQISYLFCYLYTSLNLPLPKLIKIMGRMVSAYPEEEHVVWYCKWWLSDCYVLLKDFTTAVKVFPKIPINSQAGFNTNQLLSLKLLAGQRISGQDLLTLNGPQVTSFGKKNIEEVSKYLEIVIRAKEESENINLLEQWKNSTSASQYPIFTGSFKVRNINIPYYSFTNNPEVANTISKLSREAENTVREEMGIPRVGEGWVSETELYYKLKNCFSDIEVIPHARPKWIGRQHLDIFIPSLKIAIEYQGAQHFKPIEYFGGEQSYQATLKRDSQKKRKCKANGVRLIYVQQGYIFDELLKEIIEKG